MSVQDTLTADAAVSASVAASPATPASSTLRADRAARSEARQLLTRSRSVWVSVALIVAAAASVLLIVELVLFALGRPPAILSPGAMHAAVTGGGVVGGAIAGGAIVLALVCLWGALSPGRTGRRVLRAGRAPFVVEDGVLAGALSRSAARAASLEASHVSTSLSSRRARIVLTPQTGFEADHAAVSRAANRLIDDLGAAPRLRARVTVSEKGRLS